MRASPFPSGPGQGNSVWVDRYPYRTRQDSNVTGQYRSDGRIESNTIAYLDSTQMNIANYESGAGHSPDCGSAAGSPPVWA